MSKILSQKEIDDLLEEVELKDNKSLLIQDSRKIKTYDFKRPDKFTKKQIRIFSDTFDSIAISLESFFSNEYGISAAFNALSVDQLTVEEFIRSLPMWCSVCSFDWLDGYGIFEMDQEIFYSGLLGKASKICREMNGLESKFFYDFIFKPFENIFIRQFENKASKKFDESKNHLISANPYHCFKTGNSFDMGILVTFEVKIGTKEGFVNLFLNSAGIEKLAETKFFAFDGVSNLIHLSRPEPEITVEFGKFRLEENFIIEKNMIFELHEIAGCPQNIYKNGILIGQGNTVLIDDNYGIRVTTNLEDFDGYESDDFYNAKVIVGSCTSSNGINFAEGSIIELNELCGELFKIEKDGKILAYGEPVVMDEKYGIRVKKVCD